MALYSPPLIVQLLKKKLSAFLSDHFLLSFSLKNTIVCALGADTGWVDRWVDPVHHLLAHLQGILPGYVQGDDVMLVGELHSAVGGGTQAAQQRIITFYGTRKKNTINFNFN